MLRKNISRLCVACMLVLSAVAANAATMRWVIDNGDWSLAANWDQNRLPTSSDEVWIANNRSAYVTLPNQTARVLYLGDSTGSGTVQMTGGSLTTSWQYVGYQQSGMFNQSGGTNTPGNLFLGNSAGVTGTYNLSDSGQISATNFLLGLSGNGIVRQTGGKATVTYMVSVGSGTNSTGSYDLSGTGQLTAQQMIVGDSGQGTFTQSGGKVTVTSSSQSFSIATNVLGKGTYKLDAGQLSVCDEYVGSRGVGTFDQSGGTHSVSLSLYLGYYGTGVGAYNLHGTGVSTITGNLYLGWDSNNLQTFNLSENGQFSAAKEYIGYQAGNIAVFNQSGGTNTTTLLTINSNSSYILSGGTLNINGLGLVNQGIFDGGNTPATLTGANSILDFSPGELKNTAAMSVNMGANSLIVLPAGFNPSTDFHSFTSAGVVSVAGNTIVVTAGKGFSGTASLNDKVDCRGTISAASGNAINLNNGLMLSGTGNVNLGSSGSLIVKDMTSGIAGGTLTAYTEYIGNSGTGLFTHSAGTNSMSYALYLGNAASDVGEYILSGNAQLSSTQQYIGYNGTGTFTQTGGKNTVSQDGQMWIAYNVGSTGTYKLSGTGQLTTGGIRLGDHGTGNFLQSGGTVTLTNAYNGLMIGCSAGAYGYYRLDAGQLTTPSGQVIGYDGATGVFTQTGGTNSASSLNLGSYNAKSVGTYNLSDGTLTATSESIGSLGKGEFFQTGGTHTASYTALAFDPGSIGCYTLSGASQFTISSNLSVGYRGTGTFSQIGGTLAINGSDSYGGLFLGHDPNSSGTYNLSGGQLSAVKEFIKYDSTATAAFNQSGGKNTTTYLAIAAGAQYVLRGGTLEINGGLINTGTFDGANGSGTLVGANCIIDFSTGTFTNMETTAVNIGANSLVILPAGFDPNTGFKSYASAGLTHNLGTTLTIPAGKILNGWGTIPDLVDCQGTIAATSSGLINLNGLKLSGTGNVNLGQGDLNVNDTRSSMTGGTIISRNQYVGNGGTGVFDQSGGTNNISTGGKLLIIGNNSGDDGTYKLSVSAQLSAYFETIGEFGKGMFNQSGGTNQTNNGVVEVGHFAGSNGTYTLSGGNLYAASENIGDSGTGIFMQSGGTNTISNNLYIAWYAGSYGTYTLSGGTLNATVSGENIGINGTGVFDQSGGTNNISYLVVGVECGGNGTYTLSGTGKITAVEEHIGSDCGTGKFNQTGGTNTVSTLLEIGGGTYNLNGGTLIAKSIAKGSGTPIFNFGGGTLQASSPLTFSIPAAIPVAGVDAKINTSAYTVTVSAIISGPGGLNKSGTSSLTLTANNSYTGPTTISAGTLILSGAGSIAASSSIQLAPNGNLQVYGVPGGWKLGLTQTLSGAGKLYGNVTINGVHSPGSPLAIQTFSGNYSMFGELDLDLHGTTAGTGYDQVLLNVSGSSKYNATLGGKLMLDWSGMPESTDVAMLWILKNDTDGLLTGQFSNYDNGTPLGLHGGRYWCIWYKADTATGSLTGGNDVLIAAVPEPSTLVLLGMGGIGLIAYGWRRRKAHRIVV